MNHTAAGRHVRENPMFWLALSAAVAAVFSALAALATVVVSFHIGKQHVQNARQQIENAAQQTDEARTVVQNASRLLSVQVTREFRDEFDSVGMQRRRMATASALLKGTTPPTANVLDFFESLGNYVQKGVLDKEVVWNEFREEVVHYWPAVRSYVAKIRAEPGGDTEYYANFEWLNGKLLQENARRRHTTIEDVTPNTDEVREFHRMEAAPSTGRGRVQSNRD